MNAFTILLSVLMHEVKSEIDITPVRILVPQNVLSENSNLHVICSTFGFVKNTDVYVYLCNNGTGVKRQNQKIEENDTTFILNKVTQKDSGGYSCVYSKKKFEPSEVSATGGNTIPIRVIANFQPADLSLSGPSSVRQGAQVEFICSHPEVLQTLGNCRSIQSYLMRDRVIYQVQGFDVKQREARFVIQDAGQEHSGLYTCVVRPSQCFKEDEESLTGNNEINLQVEGFPLGLTVFLGVLAMMLLLGICLCAMWRGGVCNSCMKHSQVNNSDATELQRDTEREPSDAQEHSFDEDNSWYENLGTDDPYSCPSALVPVYDEVLDSEGPLNGNPSEPAYAMCQKEHN